MRGGGPLSVLTLFFQRKEICQRKANICHGLHVTTISGLYYFGSLMETKMDVVIEVIDSRAFPWKIFSWLNSFFHLWKCHTIVKLLILLKELFSKTVNTIGQQFAKCFCGTIFSLNYSLIAKKERISSEVKSFWKLSAPNSAEKTFANIKSSSSSAAVEINFDKHTFIAKKKCFFLQVSIFFQPA